MKRLFIFSSILFFIGGIGFALGFYIEPSINYFAFACLDFIASYLMYSFYQRICDG